MCRWSRARPRHFLGLGDLNSLEHWRFSAPIQLLLCGLFGCLHGCAEKFLGSADVNICSLSSVTTRVSMWKSMWLTVWREHASSNEVRSFVMALQLSQPRFQRPHAIARQWRRASNESRIARMWTSWSTATKTASCFMQRCSNFI